VDIPKEGVIDPVSIWIEASTLPARGAKNKINEFSRGRSLAEKSEFHILAVKDPRPSQVSIVFGTAPDDGITVGTQ
jgi:hypothetical protein